MRVRLVSIALVVLAASCGGRTYEVLLDSDEQATGAGVGAGTGGAAATSSTSDVGSTAVGSGGDGGGGGDGGAGTGASGAAGPGSGGSGEGGAGGAPPSPVDCFLCIGQSCPEAIACFQDPVCSQGLFCTFQNCLGGGAPDLMCVTDCFGGDFGAALQALQVFGCVIQSCGDACGGLLPLPGG